MKLTGINLVTLNRLFLVMIFSYTLAWSMDKHDIYLTPELPDEFNQFSSSQGSNQFASDFFPANNPFYVGVQTKPIQRNLSQRDVFEQYVQAVLAEAACRQKYYMTLVQKDKLMSTYRYKKFTQQLLADDTLPDEVVLELWQQFCDLKNWPFGNDRWQCDEQIKRTLKERKAKRERSIQQKFGQCCLAQAEELQNNIVQLCITDTQELLHIQQEAMRTVFDQHQEKLSLLSDEWMEIQDMYQCYDLYDDGRYERRKQALNCMAHEGLVYETKTYVLSSAATKLFRDMGFDITEYQNCYGNNLQQTIHQECIDGIYGLTLLPVSSVVYSYRESLADCFDAARGYNKAGHAENAMAVVDFCFSLLDYGKAIVQGTAAGVIGAVEDMLEHPGQAVLCAVAGEYVFAYQLSKVLYNVVEIGTTYAFDPERGKKEWNEYVAPVAELIDVISKKELSLHDAIKGTAQIAVQWKAQGKFLNGINKFCNAAKTKAVEFVKSNPLAKPEQYMTTPEGILLQSTHHIEQPTANPGSGLRSRELVLPQMQSYEQARNKALDIIGSVDPHTAEPHIGKMGSCKGKITGLDWHDGKVTLRLDWDPVKQAHINVTDYRAGSGRSGKSIAIPFQGDESVIESLLKHLNSSASIDAAINTLKKSKKPLKLDMLIKNLKDEV